MEEGDVGKEEDMQEEENVKNKDLVEENMERDDVEEEVWKMLNEACL